MLLGNLLYHSLFFFSNILRAILDRIDIVMYSSSQLNENYVQINSYTGTEALCQTGMCVPTKRPPGESGCVGFLEELTLL